MKTISCHLPLVLLTAFGWLLWPSLSHAQQNYPKPDAAVQALVDALGTEHADQAQLAKLFGSNWKDYVPTGSVDRSDVDAFLKMYQEHHTIEMQPNGNAQLAVGKDNWTFPVPLAKIKDGWQFDLKAGADEIRARRIGRDETAAIQSVRAYYDAQMDYAETDQDGDDVLEYAQRLISTDGAHDGLYWADDDSGEASPLGPQFGDATPGGAWHGYHFRILTAQGPSAPGGAHDYMLGDNMTRGFAVIAWPAQYADSGIMSFMISHAGEVFQKDLGPQGDKMALKMTRFDPDSSWTKVPDDASGDDKQSPASSP